MSKDQILAYQPDKYRRRTTVEPGDISDNAPILASADTQEAAIQQPSASSASPTTISHKVTAGHTLTSIPSKYGVQAADIRSANNLRRNAVRVGQVLTINGVDPEIAAAARKDNPNNMLADNSAKEQKVAAEPEPQTRQQTQAQKKTEAAANPTKSSKTKETAKNTNNSAKKSTPKKQKQTIHTIKSGENLGRIAKKYGVTVDAIKKANPSTASGKT